MMRDTSERRQKISAMIREYGNVQVTLLADHFSVSTQTIRKDLHYLSEQGVTVRSYGGATSSYVVNGFIKPLGEKKCERYTEKASRLGKLAASLVLSGDSIILDAGATTSHIAHHLPDSDEVTVVTNDFSVISELVRKPNINIIMLGGRLRREKLAFYGLQAEEAVEELRVTKLFLEIDGFDLQHGVTTHFESKAELNRKMFDVALETIVVTDSSKFNKMCLHKIINTENADILITDQAVPKTIIKGCKAHGITIKTAK